MDPKLKTLKASLEAIRDMAITGLNQIAGSEEEYWVSFKMEPARPRAAGKRREGAPAP